MLGRLLHQFAQHILVHVINEGWVGKESVSGVELADIIVNGDMAVTKTMQGDSGAPFGFHFYREGDTWKINLTEMLKVVNLIMQKQAIDVGVNEDEFILMLLEESTGKKIHESIWEPVR